MLVNAYLLQQRSYTTRVNFIFLHIYYLKEYLPISLFYPQPWCIVEPYLLYKHHTTQIVIDYQYGTSRLSDMDHNAIYLLYTFDMLWMVIA